MSQKTYSSRTTRSMKRSLAKDLKKLDEIISQGEVSPSEEKEDSVMQNWSAVESDYFDEMPGVLKKLYQILGGRDISLRTKSFWEVVCLAEFEEDARKYSKSGQDAVRMFAMKYEGLGWAIGAFYIVETGKVFLSSIGGSNGYDSHQNWQNIAQLDPQELDPENLVGVLELLEMDVDEAQRKVSTVANVEIDWSTVFR